MKPIVVVTRRIPDALVRRLGEHFTLRLNDADDVLGPDRLRAQVADAWGVFSTITEQIDGGVLAASPSLRVVSQMAVGVNNIDVTAAKARGVAVLNTPGVLRETTADLAVTLLLATARRVTEAERFLRNGLWVKW